jgi:hypothetical protein
VLEAFRAEISFFPITEAPAIFQKLEANENKPNIKVRIFYNSSFLHKYFRLLHKLMYKSETQLMLSVLLKIFVPTKISLYQNALNQ